MIGIAAAAAIASFHIRGCGAAGAAELEGPMYNCLSKEVWGENKTAWCCEQEGLGCEGEAETVPRSALRGAVVPNVEPLTYNCASREAWGENKTAWCCEQEGLGCEGEAETVPRSALRGAVAPKTEQPVVSDRASWHIVRQSCGGTGSVPEMFLAGVCLQALSNPTFSVIYTCDGAAHITEELFMNPDCGGTPQTQAIAPDICRATALGIMFKYSCYSEA